MRKLIAITLALLLIVCMAIPASAVTTLRWDWGKARQSIGNAAGQIMQQTEPTEATEPSATEYTMAATEPAPVAEPDPVPVEDTRPAYIPSWRDWLTPWARLFGSKE